MILLEQSDLYYYFKPMENKLEQLLNSLVRAWWKPRWYEMHWIHCSKDRFTLYLPNMIQWNYSIRDLVSKSSWLWQFVCENGMREERTPYNRDCDTYWFTIQDYQYRLIESSLCDEDKLEEFLLSNIKVDVENRW